MEAVKTRMESAIEQLPEAFQVKLDGLGRKGKRKQLRLRHGADSRPFARFRSGIRTGTTPHFKLWMADLQIRRALQGTTLASLADRHEDPKMAANYGILQRGGFRNVWDLTQANKRDLLAVRDFGSARLAQVKADLAKHQVAVNW